MNADLAPLVARYRELVREELLRPALARRRSAGSGGGRRARPDPPRPAAAGARRAGAADRGRRRRGRRGRSARGARPRPDGDGGDRERSRSVCTRSARGGCARRRCDSRTRRTCAMSSTASCRRSAGVSTSRARWSTRASQMAAGERGLPPLAVDGPLLTIRKFSAAVLSIATMVDTGSVRAAHAELLERAVRGRLNVVISGGTGTGKTTLLNALAAYIDPAERIVTVEDAAELRLPQRMWRDSRPGRPTRGQGRITSAPSCATRCACGPTGSWSARCAEARRWICCRR